MPTNLDALIRYKTLDQCFATGRRYTLEELAERCSEALSEKSGYTRSVSTRTIQDDIRVLRGDQLAFNAPIEVRDGLYYYAEPGEYVFRRNIYEQNDLKKILEALIDVLRETKIRKLLYLIWKLDEITKSGIYEEVKKEMDFGDRGEIRFRKGIVPVDQETIDKETGILQDPYSSFCWEEVMDLV